MNLFGECQFKKGDVAYYRSPASKYSIRKAKVCRVEKKKRRLDRFFLPYYEITLENGVTMRSTEAFATRQEAETFIVKELKTRLAFQQVKLDNLQHEMAYEAALLKRLTKSLTHAK